MTHTMIGSRRSRVTVVLTALAALAALAAPALVATDAQALVAPAAAAPCRTAALHTPGRFQHDDEHVSAAVKAQVQRVVEQQTAVLHARTARTGAAPLPAEIHVPVWIHVIHGSHKRDRSVSRAQARQMFYLLRAGFAGKQDPTMTPTGIKFDLVRVTVSRKDAWFHAGPGTKADRRMKESLHRGTARTLNIYLNDAVSDGGALLGIARFPWLVARHRELDGVTINVASLPGGRARGYNLGDTVIHEVGHWFGLFHTFEGGCGEPGDFINDTPAEAEPSFDCDRTRDTCPSVRPADWAEGDPEPAPVLDPVQNFMDYSYDFCMNHFTPGQRARAVTLFLRFRAGR